ncbi:phosphatase [Sutcliffiella horikoshii]|uniref:phosphatase n=1 Tax=Sutcliffiella horikoshii TaxID=79883 RepID=UPI001CFC9FA9|nr:phosphatase [Sutcliffiella horikoshii]
MKLKTFNDINITNPLAPYFQVGDRQRIRFGWTVLEENPGLLKEIFKSLKLEKQSKVDCTFLSAYESEGFKQKEKLHLGRKFVITNWKETKIWSDDLECTCVYTTITNLNAERLYRYMIGLMKGHERQLHICFYNETYLLYTSSDVLDIVSSESNISILKDVFREHYDKYHEEGEGGESKVV